MTAPSAYQPGSPVWWNHQLRGGYGYTERVPGIVLGASPKRVWVGCTLRDGTYKRVLVSAESLSRRDPAEQPRFPIDATTQTARSTA